jgi:N-glycosylase/DNA lyase
LLIPNPYNDDERGGQYISENRKALKEIKALYNPVKTKIRGRLNEFRKIWQQGDDYDIFAELVFCLLTPQSKAKSCDSAVGSLIKKNLILNGSLSKIAKELKDYTRFHNNKARYIVVARKTFTINGSISIKNHITSLGDTKEVREWFVSNVKGLGYKEASHFLRNIGFGEDLAILDRHILKNLKIMGIIEEIPTSMTKRRYFRIENKMREFSKRTKIPMAHLDLLLWYKETGEIFK